MCIVAKDHAPTSPAALLPGPVRQQIALDALAGRSPSGIAAQNHVSRKFVYQQLRRARAALEQAFAPKPDEPEPVLFYLPVTRTWMRQFVLALVLLCHSPLRGVVELLRDLFDFRLSLGSVYNIVHSAVAAARQVNAQEDLSGVRIGVHDEIFQASQPVLVGVDAFSTYCYLLQLHEHRDGDSWGVALLECVDRGLQPEATIADAAKGLRAGQEQALPGVPCRGDVFHCLYEMAPLVRYLQNRAYEAMAAVEKLAAQQKRHEWRKGRKQQSVAQKLRYARQAEAKAIVLADEVATLLGWMQRDILAVAGPDEPTRRELLAFVAAELAQREAACPHRIGPVRSMLVNQGPDLLAFAAALDKDLAALAAQCQVSPTTIRQILQVQQMAETDSRRWQREVVLRRELAGRYYALSEAVAELSSRVVRASSLVENVNSRLRSYFFLRRQVGPDYLELLRFYLNHRRFTRSEHAERQGKSPRELLRGQAHEHWLELLGYPRFRRAA
jgi:hypothetical protein